MTENLKKLLAAMSENKELSDKISAVPEGDEARKTIIAIAKEAGIELTEEDINAENQPEALSDDDLEAVAGGKKCTCVVGGGGEKSWDDEKVCACVMAGVGLWDDDSVRCACPALGSGK